ncbi:hypothetical protein GOV08_05635 [Candidatus Woesearchaeota archaeon]|nr:hypothetical protein [Candidatus Woesearchaeota archaeon]
MRPFRLLIPATFLATYLAITGCGGGGGDGGSPPGPKANNPPIVSLQATPSHAELGDLITAEYKTTDAESDNTLLDNTLDWDDGNSSNFISYGNTLTSAHRYLSQGQKNISVISTDTGENSEGIFDKKKTTSVIDSVNIHSWYSIMPGKMGLGNGASYIGSIVAIPVGLGELSDMVQADGQIIYNPLELEYVAFNFGDFSGLLQYTVGLSKDTNGNPILGELNFSAVDPTFNGIPVFQNDILTYILFRNITAGDHNLSLQNAEIYDPNLNSVLSTVDTTGTAFEK